MKPRFENTKANFNVVWLVAVVAGAFVANFAYQALRPATWRTIKHKDAAASALLRLHHMLEAFRKRFSELPDRYSQLHMAYAVDNADFVMDGLEARVGQLSGIDADSRGVQFADYVAIVAALKTQLDRAWEYASGGCRGPKPALVSRDWFDEKLLEARFDSATWFPAQTPILAVVGSDTTPARGAETLQGDSDQAATPGPRQPTDNPRGKLTLHQGGLSKRQV